MSILTNEEKAIKHAIENSVRKGRLQRFAHKLDTDLEDLYHYYIREKQLPTAEELVEELE